MKAGEILQGAAGTAISVALCALAALAQQTAPASSSPTSGKSPQKTTAASKPSAPKTSGAAKAATEIPEADNKGGKNRDPFRTLMAEKKPTGLEIPLRLPPGKKGLVIEQLALQGIARGLDGGWIAVVDNKTRRAYFLREKDELYNGVVSKVLPDRVVFDEATIGGNGKKATREVVLRLSGDTSDQ